MVYNMTMNKRNYIHNGDCLEFMKDYSGDINLILTSPPYNMTKRPGGNADSGRYDEYEDWKEEKLDEYLTSNAWQPFQYNEADSIWEFITGLAYDFRHTVNNKLKELSDV